MTKPTDNPLDLPAAADRPIQPIHSNAPVSPPPDIFAQQGDGPPHEARPRLIVVGHVCHQQPFDDAGPPAEIAWVRYLASREQPVRRTMTVGEEWRPIYAGWLTSCSAVVVHNHEGERRQRIPTEEEKAATAAKVIELSFSASGGDGDWRPDILCLPGESQGPFCPANLESVHLRCRKGEARITVNVYPE